MPETVTRKSACILCYVNCGIEVEIEDGRMKRVRGDKDNPKSHGYICQKAGRLPFYANDRALRLTSPLRRNETGGFDEIGWDVAIAEIAAKLNAVRDTGRAQAFGYYGGGGQGSVMGGVFGQALRGVMGSGPYFSAVSQEKTGDFWVNGHMFGAHNIHTAEDVHGAELTIVLGCNPWMVSNPDGKVHLAIPEMFDWMARLDVADVKPDPDYPIMLIGGQRRHYNANQAIRDPRWRKNDPAGALHMHPDDLAAAGGIEGGWLAVVTPAGRLVARVESDPRLRLGQASLPHGYGQIYDTPHGKVTIGPRLNVITMTEDCDPIARTPHHKNVAIRVELPTPDEIRFHEEQEVWAKQVTG